MKVDSDISAIKVNLRIEFNGAYILLEYDCFRQAFFCICFNMIFAIC